MSTHQVPIVEVHLEPHPNGQNLSLVRIGGYQVCANTKDWEGKKYGAYIEPDSLVPVNRKEFDFLSKDAKSDGYARIKARKIRDVISYGLLVPAPEGTKLGDDVMELLGVKHYDPEVEEMQEELKGGKVRTKAQCAKAPTLPWIASLSKYDLENVKSYMSVLQEGEEVIIREKLDGSNVRVVWWDNQLHVGSRTRWVKQFEEPITYEELIANGCTPEKAQEVLATKQKQGATNVYWQCILNTPEVGEFCRHNPGILLYGECFGNAGKIKYNLDKKNQFGVFDIMKDGRFLDAQDHLAYPELPWAPVVTKDFKVRYDFEMAKALAEEKSFINSDCIREGIVISPIKERWNEKVGRVKMKIVSAQYLLMKGKK